jgi:hypothetical protein
MRRPRKKNRRRLEGVSAQVADVTLSKWRLECLHPHQESLHGAAPVQNMVHLKSDAYSGFLPAHSATTSGDFYARFAHVGRALRESSHDGGLRRRLFKSFGLRPKDEPAALPPYPPSPKSDRKPSRLGTEGAARIFTRARGAPLFEPAQRASSGSRVCVKTGRRPASTFVHANESFQ